MLGSPAAGVSVTESTALQLAAVWGSVGLLADAVSTLPLHQYRGKGLKAKQINPSPLIVQPYSELSLQDWLIEGMLSLGLRGNFYGHVISRDDLLFPTQIAPVHPDQVSVLRNKRTGDIEYRFANDLIPTDDVFHVRWMSIPGSVTGLSPIEACKNTFGSARASDLYGNSFFANSALPSGTIEVDGDLDEDEALKLARAWNQAHQGINAAHLPAVLTGGARFNALSITPDDAQFLQTKQYTAGEISGLIYRIPPHMLGIVDRTTSWGTGIEQQELGFVRNTLGAWLKKWQAAFNRCVPEGQHVKFDLRDRLRGDTLQRMQAYQIERMIGLRSVNEMRPEEGWEPLDPTKYPQADDPFAPLASATSGAGPGAPSPNPDSPDAGAAKSPSGL